MSKAIFANWLSVEKWNEVFKEPCIDSKANTLQTILVNKFHEVFKEKEIKVSEDDQPWFSSKLKSLDRLRRREFFKHQKSDKWRKLNREFKELVSSEKKKYYSNTVKDLKTSDPRKWYSKLKRMSGKTERDMGEDIEEFEGLSDSQQAELLANFFSATRNEFEPIKNEDFSDFLGRQEMSFNDLLIDPSKVVSVVKK